MLLCVDRGVCLCVRVCVLCVCASVCMSVHMYLSTWWCVPGIWWRVSVYMFVCICVCVLAYMNVCAIGINYNTLIKSLIFFNLLILNECRLNTSVKTHSFISKNFLALHFQVAWISLISASCKHLPAVLGVVMNALLPILECSKTVIQRVKVTFPLDNCKWMGQTKS